MPTSSFDTLAGGGGPVAFTTTIGATTRTFDTLSSLATPQPFTTSVPSATFTPAKMLVEAWSADNGTYLGALDESYDRSFQDELSGLGRGTASVLSSSANASLNPGVLRFKIATPQQLASTGGVYAFASRVEQKQWRYGQDEDAGRGFTLSGRGLVSAWEDAIVFPYGGTGARPSSDSRAFGWFSPELSTDGWLSATVAIAGLAPNTRTVPPLPDPWFPPLGWTSDILGSDWIWSRNVSTGSPEGSSLFRSTFTLASADRVSIFYTASSRCRVWVDGVLVTPGWTSEPNEESFIYAHRATPYLTAGTHYIAIEAESRAWTPALPSVCRGILQCTVYKGGGVGGNYDNANRLLGTTSSWKALDYPTVYPAPTPGRILRALLEEAQARGALTGWTLSCTDAADSAGQAWPVNQAFTFRVGQNLADVLRQMADTSIEYRAQPAGLRLDVYRKGTVIAPNAATFTIGSNLADLEEDQPK